MPVPVKNARRLASRFRIDIGSAPIVTLRTCPGGEERHELGRKKFDQEKFVIARNRCRRGDLH